MEEKKSDLTAGPNDARRIIWAHINPCRLLRSVMWCQKRETWLENGVQRETEWGHGWCGSGTENARRGSGTENPRRGCKVVDGSNGDKRPYLSCLPGGLGCELITRSFTWVKTWVETKGQKWQKTHLRSICEPFATQPATTPHLLSMVLVGNL